MKNKQIIFPILFLTIILGMTSPISANSFQIQERIQTHQFLEKNQFLLNQNSIASHQLLFIENMSRLPREIKEKIVTQIKILSTTLPDKIIRPYIYWTCIEKDPQKIQNLLAYFMFYKALTLRDYIEDPLNTNLKETKNFLSSFYKIENLNTHNLVEKLLPYLNSLAEKIAKIENSEQQIQALITTPEITQKFRKKLKNYKPYIVNNFGYIKGNQFANNLSLNKVLQTINLAKESLIIDFHYLQSENNFQMIDTLLKNHKLKPILKSFIIADQNQSKLRPYFDYLKRKIESDPTLQKNIRILNYQKNRSPANVDQKSEVQISGTNELFLSQISNAENMGKQLINNYQMIIDGNTSDGAFYTGNNKLGYREINGPLVPLLQFSLMEILKDQIPTPIESFYDSFDIIKESFPYRGNETLRMAKNSKSKDFIHGFEARNTIIDMITKAKSNIYLDHFFIYGPSIIDSLIKRKIQIPELRVLIITDNNESLGLNGIPNTFFLKELLKFHIKVRARRSPSSLSQNITSVDGKMILASSTNLAPDTMQFQLEQFNIQNFSLPTIAQFDQNFLALFYNKEQTIELDIDNFQVIFGNKALDYEHSAIFNGFGSLMLRNAENFNN